MTDTENPITSDEELHAELMHILRRAHDGGLDVKGGWDCRNGGAYPDWDVVVTEVRRTEHTD